MPELEPFSAGYSLVRDVTVEPWSNDEAHMDVELYENLAQRVGTPLVGYVNGLHYQFKPSSEVLGNRCAIPDDGTYSLTGNPTLLLQK